MRQVVFTLVLHILTRSCRGFGGCSCWCWA